METQKKFLIHIPTQIAFSIAFLCCFFHTKAQTFGIEQMAQKKALEQGIVTRIIIIDGDTMPFMDLPAMKVQSKRVFKSKRHRRRYRNLERKVRKVYPYAQEAGRRMRVYNDTLSKIKSEIKRKAFTKQAEKEIKKEFMKDLQKLTMSEGRILVRLIDRETGMTSYTLLREMRGVVSATFWQTFAKLWGNDLKTEYDPSKGIDKTIEEIIRNIEHGAYD